MEATHKKHRLHIKVGKDAEEDDRDMEKSPEVAPARQSRRKRRLEP